MNPLLDQFLSEARDFLQGIGEKVIALEGAPDDPELMAALFRLVHTLKGNSGFFEFPEMTRVPHAGEDLLDAVRHGQVPYSKALADRLLDAMDFVATLCRELEAVGGIGGGHAADSARLARSHRELMAPDTPVAAPASSPPATPSVTLDGLPAPARAAAERWTVNGDLLSWVTYSPSEDCFFRGEDPFFLARSTPDVIWSRIQPKRPWPTLAELDPYNSALEFELLSSAPTTELDAHFRYVAEQVQIRPVTSRASGRPEDERVALTAIVDIQREILALPVVNASDVGRLRAAATVLARCIPGGFDDAALQAAVEDAVAARTGAPILSWVDARVPSGRVSAGRDLGRASDEAARSEARAARRAEETTSTSRSLKVDQAKVDRLMNLIGEMVVAKNALPYLAARAEGVFGSRDLAREIKAQYAVMNRIAEELQGAIMQVRMMPLSMVFQRFPRLVRDTARKLGKEVHLILEGEDTEADKTIVESLGEPLVHIVRNSLDHGFETPEVRRACGKPETGTLVVRASQEIDRVVIEVADDGKGIDPDVVKRKARERGLIDDETMARLTHEEALDLIFAPGFSTAETVSELSGRGVGMDVVRTAVEKVNGTLTLTSEKGRGTRILLTLPISMAITRVMVVRTADQLFGVPMDAVVETVRVPRSRVRTIQSSMTTVLRNRIVPLRPLNALLQLDEPPRTNADDELAVLVVRMGDELLGLVVDDFRQTLELMLKPMTGLLAGLDAYSGSALLGDGSVLLVLNVKELIR